MHKHQLEAIGRIVNRALSLAKTHCGLFENERIRIKKEGNGLNIIDEFHYEVLDARLTTTGFVIYHYDRRMSAVNGYINEAFQKMKADDVKKLKR
jgi:hypothetical protein